MPQGSSDREGIGPYGVRYNDEQTRFSDRLASLEQKVALQKQEIDTLRTEQAVIKINFDKHNDRQADDAKSASADALKTLNEVRALREDFAVMKARHGTVPVETIQRLVTIIGGGFSIFALIVGGILWLAERAGGA